jgi:hypothetical protein
MVVPKIVADFTTQLSTALAVGGTTASIALNVDDDGVTLVDGFYYFTLDGASSAKECISCTKTGTSLSAIKSVSRQGIETSGVVRAHRIGCSVVITDWATYKSYIDNTAISGVSPATTSTLGGVYTTTNTASSVVVSTDDSRFAAATMAATVGTILFPVGHIYMSIVSTNPNTLLGFGTWTAWGAGRVPIGVGTGSIVATFASRASNVITVTGLTNAANNEFQTGQAVVYHTTGSVITGLTNDATYYIVRTGNLTFSLATDLTNAQNGTVISLSSDGTGTQTFTLTLTARTAGDTGGEEKHAMSSTELLAHTHNLTTAKGNASTNYLNGKSVDNTSSGPTDLTGVITSVGGNAAMNVMQPFITCYMWLRTA